MPQIDLLKRKVLIEVPKRASFWEVHNTVGQSWILPHRNIRQFLSLFQPSSVKGKIAMIFLPFLHFIPFISSLIKVKSIGPRLNPAIERAISCAFGVDDFEFGIFCGSPGRHQKITIMIALQKRCLGYCKVTDNVEVFSMFQKEAADLTFLRSKGVENIPEVLMVEEIKELPGVYLFIQTTKRNGRIRTATIGDKCVMGFISQLYLSTRKKMTFEESGLAKSIQVLQDYIYLFTTNEREVIKLAVSEVENTLSKPTYYSAYHGDFTPWNSFIAQGELFVFDFEYFQNNTIPYLDYFHFFTQGCIYNEYMTADSIYDKYMVIKKNRICTIDNADFYYTCYLLTIMSFYLKRDQGFLNERIRSCFQIWIELIKKINYGHVA